MSKGVDADIVVLDDIVQEAFSKSVRDQRIVYERHPSEFLRGLSKTIEKRILDCGNRVPVITGKPSQPSEVEVICRIFLHGEVPRKALSYSWLLPRTPR